MDVADLLAGINLSPAERRLAKLLHRLALAVAGERGYRAIPSRLVLHLPASLLALAFGTSRERLYRLLPGLKRAGLLDQGGHAARVAGRNLFDGCLWAVKLRPDAPAPKLRPDEWRHVWRDFEADLKSKRTAAALCSHLQNQQADEEAIFRAVVAVAVNPSAYSLPVDIAVNPSAASSLEVVYALPDLLSAHVARRARLIGETASALSAALRDHHSRRLYAKLLHRAIAAEHRGLRALSELQHALVRLLADVVEWDGLRRPGALLITRLRTCGAWDAWAAD